LARSNQVRAPGWCTEKVHDYPVICTRLADRSSRPGRDGLWERCGFCGEAHPRI